MSHTFEDDRDDCFVFKWLSSQRSEEHTCLVILKALETLDCHFQSFMYSSTAWHHWQCTKSEELTSKSKTAKNQSGMYEALTRTDEYKKKENCLCMLWKLRGVHSAFH